MKEINKKFEMYCRDEVVKTRNNLGLTQGQAAELLCLTERQYSELENGKCGLGSLELVLFLNRMCNDTEKFLAGLKKALEEDVDGISE